MFAHIKYDCDDDDDGDDEFALLCVSFALLRSAPRRYSRLHFQASSGFGSDPLDSLRFTFLSLLLSLLLFPLLYFLFLFIYAYLFMRIRPARYLKMKMCVLSY